MTSVLRVETMTVEIGAGCRIDEAVKDAIKLADANRCRVRFEFNGVPVTVRANSDPEDVGRWWWEIGDAKAKANGAAVGVDGIEWGSLGR